MTSLPHACTVDATGACEDIGDAIGLGFLLAGDINQLSNLGVIVRVTVEPGSITADVELNRRTAHLLWPLQRYFNAPGITRPRADVAEAVGSMADGLVTIRISSPLPTRLIPSPPTAAVA
ncbi:hypothetical protein ABZ746_23520 [Streptomyces sp. NPDC020096]